MNLFPHLFPQILIDKVAVLGQVGLAVYMFYKLILFSPVLSFILAIMLIALSYIDTKILAEELEGEIK